MSELIVIIDASKAQWDLWLTAALARFDQRPCMTFDARSVGPNRTEVTLSFRLPRQTMQDEEKQILDFLRQMAGAWPAAGPLLRPFAVNMMWERIVRLRDTPMGDLASGVLVNPTAEPLPWPEVDPASGVASHHPDGSPGAAGLPIQARGIRVLAGVDAPTLHHNLSVCLNQLTREHTAFVLTVPSGARWHLQAHWAVYSRSQDGMSFMAHLCGFAIYAPAGGAVPPLFHSLQNDQEMALVFLVVDLHRVSDARCDLRLVSMTPAGEVLARRTMDYLAKLYPEFSAEVWTGAPAPQLSDSLEQWFDHYDWLKANAPKDKRLTLEAIAKRKGYSHDHVRKMHALYRAAHHGNPSPRRHKTTHNGTRSGKRIKMRAK